MPTKQQMPEIAGRLAESNEQKYKTTTSYRTGTVAAECRGNHSFMGGGAMRIEAKAAAALMFTNLRWSATALSAATLLAGCAVSPLVAEADRAKIRKVAIAVADFPPNIEMRI